MERIPCGCTELGGPHYNTDPHPHADDCECADSRYHALVKETDKIRREGDMDTDLVRQSEAYAEHSRLMAGQPLCMTTPLGPGCGHEVGMHRVARIDGGMDGLGNEDCHCCNGSAWDPAHIDLNGENCAECGMRRAVWVLKGRPEDKPITSPAAAKDMADYLGVYLSQLGKAVSEGLQELMNTSMGSVRGLVPPKLNREQRRAKAQGKNHLGGPSGRVNKGLRGRR